MFSKLVPGGNQLNFPMNNARTNRGLDACALILAQPGWATGPTVLFHWPNGTCHLIMRTCTCSKGEPKLPVPLTPFEYSWSALIFKALDFVSLGSPPFGGQRGACPKWPANFTITAATLQTLLRKCKEFYKIVALTSHNLWTLVPLIVPCSFTGDWISLWLNLCQGTRTTDWLLRLLKSQMYALGKGWTKKKKNLCPWQTSIINHRTFIPVQDPSSKFAKELKTTISNKSQGTVRPIFHFYLEQPLYIKQKKGKKGEVTCQPSNSMHENSNIPNS